MMDPLSNEDMLRHFLNIIFPNPIINIIIDYTNYQLLIKHSFKKSQISQFHRCDTSEKILFSYRNQVKCSNMCITMTHDQLYFCHHAKKKFMTLYLLECYKSGMVYATFGKMYNMPTCIFNSDKAYMLGSKFHMWESNKHFYEIDDGKFIKLKSTNYSRRGCSLSCIGDYIYTIGGKSSKSSRTIEVYDKNKNEWKLLGYKLQIPRYNHVSVVIDYVIYIGGCSNSIEGYNVKLNVGFVLADLPNGGIIMAVNKNLVNRDLDGNFYSYDFVSNRWIDMDLDVPKENIVFVFPAL